MLESVDEFIVECRQQTIGETRAGMACTYFKSWSSAIINIYYSLLCQKQLEHQP